MSATITNDDRKRHDWLGVEDTEAEEDDAGSGEEESRVKGISRATKRRKVGHVGEEEGDNEKDEVGGDNDEGEEAGEHLGGEKGKGKGRTDNGENDDELLFTNPNKLKPLTQDELAASKLATSKTGVIYLSRIPVYSLSTPISGSSSHLLTAVTAVHETNEGQTASLLLWRNWSCIPLPRRPQSLRPPRPVRWQQETQLRRRVG